MLRKGTICESKLTKGLKYEYTEFEIDINSSYKLSRLQIRLPSLVSEIATNCIY